MAPVGPDTWNRGAAEDSGDGAGDDSCGQPGRRPESGGDAESQGQRKGDQCHDQAGQQIRAGCAQRRTPFAPSRQQVPYGLGSAAERVLRGRSGIRCGRSGHKVPRYCEKKVEACLVTC